MDGVYSRRGKVCEIWVDGTFEEAFKTVPPLPGASMSIIWIDNVSAGECPTDFLSLAWRCDDSIGDTDRGCGG